MSKAFEKLKQAVLDNVVLAHPDFNRLFLLCVDALMDGLGAVLSQVLEGEEKTWLVAFASKSELCSSKISSTSLKILCIKVGCLR